MSATVGNSRGSDKPFGQRSIRVLVVDDDQGTREYLCELLADAGCEATAVATGEEGIQRYRCERYSVVLMDIFMPGKDGFETIMDIRRSFPEARVIAISGRIEHQGVDVMTWAKRIGAQRVLRKPFTPDELLYALAEVLQ